MSAKGQETEISLKEALLAIKEYMSEIKRCIPIILLITLPVLAYQVYKASSADWIFNAPLSFMLNEESGSSAGISSLLGSIGLPVGGNGEENLDKILELSKSRKISAATVFTKTTIDGKEDFLANHLIEMLENKGKWNEKGIFGGKQPHNIDGLRFTHDSLLAFSLVENYGLKHLQDHLTGNSALKIMPLLVSGYEEQTGIMKIEAITYHGETSVKLAKSLFEKLSEYYVNQAIEKQEQTYSLIKTKSDSIYEELQAKNFSLANFKDKNQGMFARTDKLTETKLMLEIQKLGAMYAEATKNLEVADFALKNKTPFIQLIDEPILPIIPQKISILKAIILGLFLGVFLGTVYVVTRKMFRDVLN